MMATDMAKKERRQETALTIRVPDDLLEIIKVDSDRCERSQNGQIIAILKTYYRMNSVEIFDMESTRRAVGLMEDRDEIPYGPAANKASAGQKRKSG
jgi:hypothetical protein